MLLQSSCDWHASTPRDTENSRMSTVVGDNRKRCEIHTDTACSTCLCSTVAFSACRMQVGRAEAERRRMQGLFWMPDSLWVTVCHSVSIFHSQTWRQANPISSLAFGPASPKLLGHKNQKREGECEQRRQKRAKAKSKMAGRADGKENGLLSSFLSSSLVCCCLLLSMFSRPLFAAKACFLPFPRFTRSLAVPLFPDSSPLSLINV